MTYINELKRQFPTETAFQMALYTYIYNGKYKEELQTIKDLSTLPKFVQDYVKEKGNEIY